MIELLILVAGIVAIWKYRKSVSVSAAVLEQSAETWAAGSIAEAVKEREEVYQKFLQDTDNIEITSFDEIMRRMKVDI